MEKNNEINNRAGLKYFLFLGIPVIIILGVLGAYYYLANPKTILTNTINNIYESLSSTLEKNEKMMNKPVSITGKVEYSSESNDDFVKELQNYTYKFKIDSDAGQNYTNLKLGIEEQENEILNVSLIDLNEKQYLISEKLYSGILDITSEEQDRIKNNFSKINPTKLNQIIEKTKNIFLETIDEQYISREKVDINIENETKKTTKITYLLDEYNQTRTVNEIYEKILNDNELLEILANISEKNIEEIKKDIVEEKNSFKFEKTLEITIYTEGIKQNVIKMSLRNDDTEIISYTNYKGTKKLTLFNNIVLLIEKNEKDHIIIHYEFKDEKITGTIDFKKESNEGQIMTLSINNDAWNINLELNLNVNAKINIPEIKDAKTYEELTNEELGDIFYNLEEVLKNTAFYDLIENGIM